MRGKGNRFQKTGIVVIAMGGILLAAALCLFLSNRAEDILAGERARELLAIMRQNPEEFTDPPTSKPSPEYPLFFDETTESGINRAGADTSETQITTVNDECGLLGSVAFPTLSTELPVLSEWDYDRLAVAPCRQFGSVETDDLVIAAHNYKSHFGTLSRLAVGDPVTFTDMRGTRYSYAVAQIRVLEATDVKTVRDSGYGLVLYTCTYGGGSRVTVFCNRTDPY